MPKSVIEKIKEGILDYITEKKIEHKGIQGYPGIGVSLSDPLVETPPGIYAFIKLIDCPVTYYGQAGKYPKVNATEDGLEFATPSALTFLGLSDTPSAYTGQAGKYPKVNSGENALEFATVAAGGDVGGKYGINIESLSGNKTLTPDTDKIYQYLNPNGADRDIVLATTGSSAGDRFIVRNNDSYASAYKLTIKQSTTTLDYIYAGSIRQYIFDGSNWVAAEIGTGESDWRRANTSIGGKSKATGIAVAIGESSQANSYGVSVGWTAISDNMGVAIGTTANAQGSYSTAVGFGACAPHKGSVALGDHAKTYRIAEMCKNIRISTNRKDFITTAGWRATTTNANLTEIFLGGESNARFDIKPKSILTFTILVTARGKNNFQAAAYKFEGVIQRGYKAVSFVENVILLASTKTVIFEDDANWDVAISADTTNKALIIKVTGSSIPDTVQWAARLDGVETSEETI